ncbi:MAG: hypothetical protein Q4B22_00695 [Eubacteriales bacterium]|nr:hypothetical protein [Eubacteriales bacterium]
MIKIRKAKYMIVFMIGVLCLAGCGHIRSERELKFYAYKNFGKAKMLASETTEEYTKCTFRDNKYGFEYSVESKMVPFSVDGSTAFDYQSTVTDYPEKLVSYLEEDIKVYIDSRRDEIEASGIRIAYNGHVENYLRRFDMADFENVSEKNMETAEKYAEECIAYFKRLDRKNVFHEINVIMEIKEGDSISYNAYSVKN